MTKSTKRAIEATLAVMVTLALSIVAVWFIGDARAGGMVVMAAGIAVSGLIGVYERRLPRGREAVPPAAHRAEGITKLDIAA